MKTILVVEDGPGVGAVAAEKLRSAGYRVLSCGGAPAPFRPCPLLRDGFCPYVEPADVIVFSALLFGPVQGKPYTGIEILRAYRSHPEYGRIPMVVACVADPGKLEGTGRLVVLTGHADAERVVGCVEKLLDDFDGETPSGPEKRGPTALPRRRRIGQALTRR